MADKLAMTKLVPVRRDKTLGEHVYAQLKGALMSGAFQPGQKVSARSVADAVGVSFTPAREALSRLIAEGALETKGPKTVLVPRLTPERLFEITQIRLALEGLAAEEAGKHVEPSLIEALEETQLELVAAMDRQDYKTVLSRNEAFHFTLYSASGMPRLRTIIESLWLAIGPSLNLLYPEFRLTRAGISNHLAVIRALKAGDAQAARNAIQKDIEDGFTMLSKAVSSLSDVT